MKTITLFIGMAMLITACDSSSAIENSTDTDNAAFTLLSSDLGVSSTELAALAERSGAQSVNPDGSLRDPGALWALAAELHATMTEEQRERLLEQLERLAANRQANGGRAFRPGPDRSPRGMRPGAGQRGMRPGMQGERVDALAQLDLTAEQEEAIAAIREDYRARFQTLRDDFRTAGPGPAADRDAFREALSALRKEMHAAVIGVLTAEQAATLEELKATTEAEREVRQADREARRAAVETARAEALNLTADQLAALDELEAARDAFREEVRALREAGASAEEIRAAMEVHGQAHRAAVEQILTQEQLEITGIHRLLTLRMATRRAQAGPGFGGPGLGGPGFGGPGARGRN